MSVPSSNWAAGAFQRAFQKTVTNVFYSRGVSTRRGRTRRPAQQISIESLEPRQMLSVNYQMTSVGNPGNAPDTSPAGYGAVSYDYQIGKYDVTVGQYAEFLNAKAQADPYGLYNAGMGTDRISRSGTSGNYTYAVINSTGNRPVTYVSWFDSARFSNWMSNGQGSASTEMGGYTLIDGQTTGNAPAGNAGAGFRIPTENEWYKSAYFSPDYHDSGEDGYYNYATQSDTLPGTTIGSGANQSNYNNAIGTSTSVGSFSGSGSFYGTFDQTGNVYQWNDLDGTPSYSRGWRGGSWDTVDFGGLSSSGNRTTQNVLNGSNEDGSTGFRLVTRPAVPDSPTSVGAAINSNGQPVVTWLAPANNGGSAITNYVVKYSSNAGTAWTRFRPSLPITTTSCTVTGLAIGTPYIFKVISQNAVGIGQRSANSAPASPRLLVPSRPTSVVAVRGNAQLAVTWTAPASTGGSVITDYLVKYSSNSGATWKNFTDPVSTATSCTVTGVMNGTGYVIKVVAKNAVGVSLPSANAAPATPTFMSMVTVDNPGNAADTRTGNVHGAVSYSYQIGKYDVTGSQYTAFLNAVGSTDTYSLYNASMGTDTYVAQISRSGTSGSFTYAVMNGTGNRPIAYVNWWDSARFSNWMSNGQPIGAQVSTTTENGAYNVSSNGTNFGNSVAANATNPNTGLAPAYRIPLENEWYKAAYYSPNYGGTGVGGYYRFATQSDSAPGTTIGGGANQANYKGDIGALTDVGAFSGSGSFYGTFDQTGNIYQWNDKDGTSVSFLGLRGGGYRNLDSYLVSSSNSADEYTTVEYGNFYIGFRLASPA